MFSTKRRHKICGAKDARGKTHEYVGKKQKEIKAQKSERKSRKKEKMIQAQFNPIHSKQELHGCIWYNMH